MRLRLLSYVVLCAVVWFSDNSATANSSSGNVILLMLDGVRWQEVFQGVDSHLATKESGEIFTNLHGELENQGLLFGDPSDDSQMSVANRAFLSLPAYQSIMSGFPQPCKSNTCGRIGVETFQERLVRDLSLERNQVATIGSWINIAHAVEHLPGATFVNTGVDPLDDKTSDPVFGEINDEQSRNLPQWEAARLDRYTYGHAMHYLKKYRPRFMFISLQDSDEWAHHGNYDNYVNTLRHYDRVIKELVDALKSMGEYGRNTTLLVTTDHGRGTGSAWKNHGVLWPSSRFVWMYAFGPHVKTGTSVKGLHYSHLDLRPTIESALGLDPQACKGCGAPIAEIISR